MSEGQSIFFLSSQNPTTVRLESNPPHPKSAILGLSWSHPRPHHGKSRRIGKERKYFAFHSLRELYILKVKARNFVSAQLATTVAPDAQIWHTAPT